MIRTTLSTRTRLIAITSPRYDTRSEWIEDLARLAHEVVCIDARCRAASDLAPVALWATRTRDVTTLRKVASEIIRHGEDWDLLRPLSLEARAVLAAEPAACPQAVP